MKTQKTCPACSTPHTKRTVYCCAKCYHSVPRSAESRSKQSASTKGKPKSPEHRANIAKGVRAKSLAETKLEPAYGDLMVISKPWIERSKAHVLVRCVCDREVPVRVNGLLTGNTTSCGCKRKRSLLRRNTKHGLAPRSGRHPLYNTWADMVERCTSQSHPKYADYGGRGISVCREWRNSFAAFLGHVGERPFPKAEIDRINNNGNYEPGNIRWATRRQQMQNTRVNRVLTHDGKTMVLAEWARVLGWSYMGLWFRLQRLPVHEALIPKPGRVAS